MKGLALLVVLVGCAADPKPVENPTGCLTLTGTQSQDVPLMTDASVCLHLDATPLHRAHFMVSLPGRAGTTSGFSTSLDDASGALIVDGWDVTVGQTDPQTSATLEWSPPAGTTTDVTLHVRASAATATTVGLALLDPLE
ncbi:MAG: hypothetical protein JO257_36580 [Deltaproteobacteria bacterium]|nr:hypothetical protein [Deltaproteobacteria bacterium]